MNIRLGNETERNDILEKYPYTSQVLGNGGYLIVADENDEIVGFLWGYVQDIPVSINKKEMFINVIETFNPKFRKRKIGKSISILFNFCNNSFSKFFNNSNFKGYFFKTKV